MGWTVISKGTIDFPKDTDQLLVKVYNKMKNYNHSSEDNDTVFYDLKKYKAIDEQKSSSQVGGQIYFEMSGNKGIDYEPIEQIQKFILEKLEGKDKEGLIISANEFTEAQDGFYYEYEK